ncbi:MAG: hypothetical protein PVH88_06160 [Ignavibacteria bacterium]
MKKNTLLLTILLLISTNSFAQFSYYNKLRENEGLLGGGFGLTWIDGKPHYSIRLFPEIALKNFGIGIDLKLEYDASGKIRTENFNEFSDYLSVIRYVRYGYKNDPLYIRFGAIDKGTLGHGSIIYLYNNSPSYDTRKVGVEFDIDFNTFGLESIYGNFGQQGVMGIRGYFRPFVMSQTNIPFISQMEVGATIVADVDENAGIISGIYDSQTDQFNADEDEGSVAAFGLDVGIPLIKSSVLDLDLYMDYVKFFNFGDGLATGFIFDFNGLGLVDLTAKFERRFNGDQYLPSYFNALYEIERFSLDKSTGEVTSKVQALKNAGDDGNGFYGEIYASLLNTFDVLGSYQRLDKNPESGILHLSSEVAPREMPYVVRAGYDKINIKDEGDLFKLDDRSHLYAEFGYRANEYLLISMVYHWTFTPVRDAEDDVVDYVPQKKIEPRISFIYPIGVGN